MITHNNWIYNDVINGRLKTDPSQKLNMTVEKTYLETIIKQANLIFDKHKKLMVTVSGGIDSQTIAYAFIKANLPVEYVFADFQLDTHHNDLEKTFALQFAKDNNINLKIIDFKYTFDDIEYLMFETGYFTGIRNGIGGTFQFDFLRKMTDMYPNHVIVTGCGGFKFLRTNNTCSGNILDVFNGVNAFCLNDDDDSKKKIGSQATSFIYYSPIVVDYYQSKHRMNKMLQYPTSYQPKNMSYTELGFPMRYKLSSAEHMNGEYDYKTITRLNFGRDVQVQMDILGGNYQFLYDRLAKKYSWDLIKRLRQLKHVGDRYVELYNFETDIV
jgi:hypothetical protein